MHMGRDADVCFSGSDLDAVDFFPESFQQNHPDEEESGFLFSRSASTAVAAVSAAAATGMVSLSSALRFTSDGVVDAWWGVDAMEELMVRRMHQTSFMSFSSNSVHSGMMVLRSSDQATGRNTFLTLLKMIPFPSQSKKRIVFNDWRTRRALPCSISA